MGPARIEMAGAPILTRSRTAGIRNAPISDVRGPRYKKSYIDVMENVFGGVRISTDDEIRGRAGKADLRARPWLSGLTMSVVRVRLTRDDEEDDEEGTIPPER
jgi:hypothetical protein